MTGKTQSTAKEALAISKAINEEVQGIYNTNPDPGTANLPEFRPLYSPFVIPEPLPEAGGVAWIDLYGTRILTDANGGTVRKVFKISLTCRAQSPIAALDGLKEAIDHAEKKYKLFPHSL